MAKNKEKLKRLKRQQKEREAYNKEKRAEKQREQAENGGQVRLDMEDDASINSQIRPGMEDGASVKEISLIRDRNEEAEIWALYHMGMKQEKEYVCTAAPANPFEADMKKGIEAYRSWQYDKAAKEFLDLLDKYPNEGMLYYYLANTFSYSNGMEYSLRFYKKALTLVDYVEVWVDYGNILRVLGRTEKAIAVLEEARDKFYEDGSPAMVLSYTYPDGERCATMKSEAVRKWRAHFNKNIREWESEHQLLKEQMEEFV